jgi:hypothetical protein
MTSPTSSKPTLAPYSTCLAVSWSARSRQLEGNHGGCGVPSTSVGIATIAPPRPGWRPARLAARRTLLGVYSPGGCRCCLDIVLAVWQTTKKHDLSCGYAGARYWD